MEYTIQQLAQLAGVTRRALRHYDQIGLLKPAHTTQAGWRLYGPAQVDRLQQILFYRALGLELEHIRRLLDDPAFDRRTALQSHLTELKDRRGRLDALILTVQKTLDAEQGGNRMPDTDKFECFKQDMIQKNEAQYGPELRARYGDALVDRANARLAGLTREQYDAMTTLEDEIRRDLTAAVLAGDAPDAGGKAPPLAFRLLGAALYPSGPCGAGSAVHTGQTLHRLLRSSGTGLRRVPAPRCRSLYRPLGVK